MKKNLNIYSWNVNGLRAAEKKGFLEWFGRTQPDILGIQEVRATADQLSEQAARPEGYVTHFFSAKRLGYSGVGIYLKNELVQKGATIAPFEVLLDKTAPLSNSSQRPNVGAPQIIESYDAEGRAQAVRVGNLLVVNCYFPNGNGKERDNSRVPYKLDFYERLRFYLQTHVQEGLKVLVMGDWNTAHQPWDLARPASNVKTSGFLPEERVFFSKWLDQGWVDTFRHFQPAPTLEEIDALVKDAKARGLKKADRASHPGEHHYSWWSQRPGIREKNIGWRIDYVLASPSALPYLKEAHIHADVLGSDHCPVSVTVDSEILL